MSDQRAREAAWAEGRRADVVLRIQGRRDLDVKEVGQKLGVRRRAARYSPPSRRSHAVERSAHGHEARRRALVPDLRPRHEGRVRRQDSITQATVKQLALSLGSGLWRRPGRDAPRTPRRTISTCARADASLQGTEAAERRAIDLYRRGAREGPDICQADAAIAFAYMSLADAYMPANIAYDSSRAAARRALARDSLVGDARALAAFASMALDWTSRPVIARSARRPRGSQTPRRRRSFCGLPLLARPDG
jgi:hypothetical protein